ncbi:hypothetical protein [Subtercola boreus]|nr:hypothetical protein [Subtercola boreus]
MKNPADDARALRLRRTEASTVSPALSAGAVRISALLPATA